MTHDDPPDTEKPADQDRKEAPKLTYEEAYKAYENAKLTAKAANSKLDAARGALGRFYAHVEHTPPAPRPDGVYVARPGKFKKIERLPLYHPQNIAEALLLLLLAFLMLSGAWYWLQRLFA